MNYQSDNDIQIISEKELLENVKKNMELKYPIPKVNILKENEFFILEKNYARMYLNKGGRRFEKKIKNKIKKKSKDVFYELEKEKKTELISTNNIKRRKKDLEIIKKIEELQLKKKRDRIININYEDDYLKESNSNLKELNKKNNKELNLNSLIQKVNESSEPKKIISNISNYNKNKTLDLIKYYISEVHNLLNLN